MFTLAHISDPHLGPLPDPKLLQLLSKRILGYLNWRRNRAGALGGNHLEQLIEDLKAQSPDHIAVTGDLVNIALPLEIAGARTWLEELGPPDRVAVVPGNHDAYVPGAIKKARLAWRDYMSAGETNPADSEAVFPYVRRLGDVALVGVSTARATAPWFATGRVGAKQARLLRDLLEDLGRQGLFRAVMIHHPPFRKATHWHKRLSDASRVRAVIKQAGAELVLHGHTHLATRTSLEGPTGPVPVICVPSASAAPGGKKPGARYNLFSISRADDGAFRCTIRERGFEEPGAGIKTLDEGPLEIPPPAAG